MRDELVEFTTGYVIDLDTDDDGAAEFAPVRTSCSRIWRPMIEVSPGLRSTSRPTPPKEGSVVRRPKTPLMLDLPLILFLGVFWMAVWQSFEIGTFLIGLVYATILVRVFYLPPLRGTGRVNLSGARCS